MKNRNKDRGNSKNPVQGIDNQLQQPDLQNQGRSKSPEMNQRRSGNLDQGNVTGSVGTPGQQRRSGLDESGNSL